MDSKSNESEKHKELSGRKRKKLYSKIRSQMEFYFSDSNLAKDKFLYNLIQQHAEGYVDIEIFKSFNKIKALSEDTSLIVASLSRSDILEISEDKCRVRRKSPISMSKDFDACTLYVEKLPAYADHKWIKDTFEQFGTVDYINIPRFKISHKIKGFAFIEFSSEESVVKACQFYQNPSKKENGTIVEENKNNKPGKSKSSEDDESRKAKRIKMSDSIEKIPGNGQVDKDVCVGSENLDLEKEQMPSPSKVKKKRKLENSDSEDLEPSKKMKLTTEKSSKNDMSDERLHLSDSENKHTAEFDQSDNISDHPEKNSNNEDAKDDVPSKVKRKRKHLRKNRSRSERPLLRVMSKFEWKNYRNKYLDLQRTTMSFLKKQILTESHEMREQEANAKHDQVPKKELKFQPGVIIKTKLSKAIENPTDIKEQIKSCAVVAYIDAPLGSDEVFIRCHTSDDASTILHDEKLSNIGTTKLLTGSIEEEYWKKIESDRVTKFNNPVTRKRRGRDKLITKAAKLIEQRNRHIYFDE